MGRVQVTFSMGAEYEVKPWADIIPLDSVRIGKGDPEGATRPMKHACLEYQEAAGEWKEGFDGMVDQSCGPQSTMCFGNPESVPDSFMAFNIPAGISWSPPPPSF